MKYSAENPLYITKPNQIDILEMRDYFKFKCIKCGNYQIKQVNSKYKIPTHKKMLCTHCLTTVDHYTKDKPKYINSKNDLLSCHKYDWITFNCKQCGKIYVVQYRKNRLNTIGKMICVNCYRSNYRINHPEVVIKSMETIRRNHNGLHNFSTKECRDRIKKTNLERYGVENPMYSSKTIYLIQMNRLENPEKYGSKRIICGYKKTFDSAIEFYVYLFCIYNNIPIIRNPNISFTYLDSFRNNHYVYPDFMICGRLVEIKGGHYYKEDGTWTFPYKTIKDKNTRLWRIMTPEEKKYMDDLYERKRQCLLHNNVLILRDNDPWIINCINWVNQLFTKQFIQLFQKNNPNNYCYGVTPYNKSSGKYTDIPGIGYTPFNMDKNKYFSKTIIT